MTSALAPLPLERNSIFSETVGLKGVQRLVIWGKEGGGKERRGREGVELKKPM